MKHTRNNYKLLSLALFMLMLLGAMFAAMPTALAAPTISWVNPASNEDAIDVIKGDKFQFEATASTDSSMSWALADSSNNVSTISSDGLLKVADNETAETLKVTATATTDGNPEDKITKIFTVNVKEDIINKVIISTKLPILFQGDELQLAAAVSADQSATDDDKKVTWQPIITADSGDASITADGYLTIDKNAQIDKEITVTAVSAYDSRHEATYTFVIKESAINSIKLTDVPSQISVGSTYNLKAELECDGKPGNENIIWKLTGNDKTTTTLDPSTGKLIIAGDESADRITVTATSAAKETITMSQDIVLVKKAITGISIKSAPNSLAQGATDTLAAAVIGDDTVDQTVKWKRLGNDAAGTVIDQVSGKLAIDKEETSGNKITVIAYSAYDNAIKKEIVITVTPLMVKSVVITDCPATIAKGSAYTVKATVGGDGAYDNTVAWKLVGEYAKDTKIDETTGKLTVSAKETSSRIYIQATSNGKDKDDKAVVMLKYLTVVEDAVEKVELTSAPAMVSPGESAQLAAKLTLRNTEDSATDTTILWSLSGNKKSTTTLSADGLLKIAEDEPEETVLTVKAYSKYDNSKLAVKEITVENPSLSELKITLPATTPARGEQMKFVATVKATGNADSTVLWSVSGNSSADTKFDGDTLHIAKDEDSSSLTIKATSKQDEKVSDSCALGVQQITAVSITPQSTSVKAGESKQFSAAASAVNGASTEILWSVSGNSSADTKVDAKGLLKVAAKEASTSLTVTATSKYNTNKKASASVTLSQKVGWDNVNGKWVYYNADGTMVTGWKKVGTQWYLMDSNGIMKTGWVQDGGAWYYLKTDGAMKKGWLQDGGKWYYLKSDGAMKTGWLKDAGKWYYLAGSGAMKTGWLSSGSTWYFLRGDGSMIASDWALSGSSWYYFDADGEMQVGKLTIDGKSYRFNSDGAWVR